MYTSGVKKYNTSYNWAGEEITLKIGIVQHFSEKKKKKVTRISKKKKVTKVGFQKKKVTIKLHLLLDTMRSNTIIQNTITSSNKTKIKTAKESFFFFIRKYSYKKIHSYTVAGNAN